MGELPCAFSSRRRIHDSIRVRDIEWSVLLDGQAGATHHTVDDVAVFDAPECNGVLLIPKKSLCAVNGIERPIFIRGAVMIAVIDGVEDVILAGVGTPVLHGFNDRSADHVHSIFSERACVFFTYDESIRLIRQVLGKDDGNDGLGGQIGNRDRAAVILGQGGDDIEA